MFSRTIVAMLGMVLTAAAVLVVADAREWSDLMAYATLAAVAVPVIALGVVFAEGVWPRPRERRRG